MRQPPPAGLAPDTLELLGRVLDARLPAPYRKWLAEHNGEMPENRRITFVEGGRETDTVLHYLYAVNAAEDYNDLWAYNRDYGAELRPWYIAIGGDVFGNPILLAVKGPDHGKVFFSNHENPFDDGLHVIADSFDAFLAGLGAGEP
ncbi:hypothetical protein BOO69_12970 [Sulfitobacter alexandrii]|uniref:Knr4/Smi1-like domain-containing protein n=1 Tax=Sulfitobacter alexandrii TaxID=1917485 RepID=A0A1J0WJ60_9RHOB|nr:SMI1/KNR4 family protein [Sulfitobacter alexandrii]APE44208.1 hypothetical protein BOO69_12970 [Sulfitobacter alexandrii]